jgi:diguanylate cyclase (GGDEF)-like protein
MGNIRIEDRNCELLFEYLRSILYDFDIKSLNIEELDEPYRKLGQGLQILEKSIKEMLVYSADLSNGNLSGFYPPRDNFLCTNLKNLHANLNHLTWQAQQVAKGDYSQKVSYLGEFSEAFNSMTDQLRKREMLLINQSYHDAGTEIYNKRFFTEYMEKALENREEITMCYLDLDGLKYVNDNLGHTEGDHYLNSFVELVKENIREDDIFARLGGDEFVIIFPGLLKHQMEEKMEFLLWKFIRNNKKDYAASFSYGVCEIFDDGKEHNLEEIIVNADVAMYECKRKNKEKYHNTKA